MLSGPTFSRDDFLTWLAPGSVAFRPLQPPHKAKVPSEQELKDLNIWVRRRETTQRSWSWLLTESLLCVYVGGTEGSMLHKAAVLLAEERQAKKELFALSEEHVEGHLAIATTNWRRDLRQMLEWLKEGAAHWGDEVQRWETLGFEGPMQPNRSWQDAGRGMPVVTTVYRREMIEKAKGRFSRLIPVVERCLEIGSWNALVFEEPASELLSNRHRTLSVELLSILRSWDWKPASEQLSDAQIQQTAHLALAMPEQFRLKLCKECLADDPRWPPALLEASLAEWTPEPPSEELKAVMGHGANWFRKRSAVWTEFSAELPAFVRDKAGSRHGAFDFAIKELFREGALGGSGANKRRSVLLNLVCRLVEEASRTVGDEAARHFLSTEGWLAAWRAHAASAEPSATRHAALVRYAPGLEFAEWRNKAQSKLRPEAWALVESQLLRADLGTLLKAEGQQLGLEDEEGPKTVVEKPRRAMRL